MLQEVKKIVPEPLEQLLAGVMEMRADSRTGGEFAGA
jgi:hypothetical protein